MEKLVPRLRFPGFEGDWKDTILGDVATFSKGKGISKSEIDENGKIECIRYGELYTHYGETIDEIKSRTNLPSVGLIFSEANDVIIPGSGETQLDIATASCVLKAGVALGGDLNIIKSNNDGVFLSYYLNSHKKNDIAVLAQGNAVVHLYGSQLAKLYLRLPEVEEQKKIGKFVNLTDKRINQLKKKKTLLEHYKKGMMQQIFNQEVRFKDADGKDFGEWEEKSLGECLDYEQPTKYLVSNTDYNEAFETPVLTAGKTFLLGFTNETDGIFEEGLPVIIFDDFTTATQFVDFKFKAKSSAMKILKAKNGVNIKYIYEIMQQIKYEIGGHGRHWISVFAQLTILLPTSKEQTKIANFLSAIDDKINLVGKEIEGMEQWKKGLLGELFV